METKAPLSAVAGIAACLSLLISSSSAQPGSLDFTFNPGTGANATVLSIALQTNGKIVIGGYFTTFNGANRHYVARLNTDGSVDSSFDAGIGPNGSVNGLAVQPDGKILICGPFGELNNLPWFGFARLRTDGSVDTGFANLFDGVRALGLQNDGKILVSGIYPATTLPQTNCIARVGTNGILDVTFNPLVVSGAYGAYASAFCFQSDGRIIVGGPFTELNGVPRNSLARLNSDGSVDTNFNAGIAVSGATSVLSLAMTPQDQIVVGGNFSSVNGYSRNGIARLNSDGSVDTAFSPGLGVSAGGYSYFYVSSVAVQSDGKVIIGGNFTSFNGTNRLNVARLNADGSLDLAFNQGTGAGNTVAGVACQPDGKTLIGGAFANFNGTNINGVARLNGDTSPTTNSQFMGANLYFGTHLYGTVSNTYRVEWTSQLNTPSLWTPLFNVTLQTNPQFIVDPSPAAGQRFYRAIMVSP
jgi:uncharacterized delta-60 repeat protein